MSKGPDICSLASFTNFTGIWPVDVSERSLSISCSTSIVETQPRLKECVVRGHSEKEFTRSIRSDLLSDLVASVLSNVLNVLSLSGSAWRGLGLGWRMRCTTLHTSFGRLDRWESVNNKYPFRLINHRLILLRTALKATQGYPGVIITVLLMSLVTQFISHRLQLAYLIRVHPRWRWACHFNPFKGCVSINAFWYNVCCY